MAEEIALFGAGGFGRLALKEYGSNVACFIDNDTRKDGTVIYGLPIISMKRFLEDNRKQKIVIAVKKWTDIASQLDSLGITDYDVFDPRTAKRLPFYPENRLVINDYTEPDKDKHSETDWINTHSDIDLSGDDRFISFYASKHNLFRQIEIETYNRCNGTCSFCPVSVNNDTRIEKKMYDKLFYKIIDELSELEYDGHMSLFSNNEPFLDDRIIEFHNYAREKVPKARIHLYTNGTLMSIDKYKEVITYVDELIFDNYNDKLLLNPNAKKIVEYCYCDDHRELIKKTDIVIRKRNEILTSRGGDAPNRSTISGYPENSCLYPFMQMIIRPDGKCSLCCNDPLGKSTLGDVNNDSIYNIWYSEQYENLRKSLLGGRKNVVHCVNCDNIYY